MIRVKIASPWYYDKTRNYPCWWENFLNYVTFNTFEQTTFQKFLEKINLMQ